jgi:hypothetical protein
VPHPALERGGIKLAHHERRVHGPRPQPGRAGRAGSSTAWSGRAGSGDCRATPGRLPATCRCEGKRDLREPRRPRAARAGASRMTEEVVEPTEGLGWVRPRRVGRTGGVKLPHYSYARWQGMLRSALSAGRKLVRPTSARNVGSSLPPSRMARAYRPEQSGSDAQVERAMRAKDQRLTSTALLRARRPPGGTGRVTAENAIGMGGSGRTAGVISLARNKLARRATPGQRFRGKLSLARLPRRLSNGPSSAARQLSQSSEW